MHKDESKALLRFLYDHITKDEFIYKHRWQQNMLIMWDNRSVLHSAQGGYDGHQRIMHRTVVTGEKPIPAAA
jgi:taurine dioxygenase